MAFHLPLNRLRPTIILPSWLSGVVCLFIALAVVVGICIATHYTGSPLQQEFAAWRSSSLSEDEYAIYDAQYGSDPFRLVIDSILTFLFWAFVMVAVYAVAAAAYTFFRSAHRLKQELDYVHASRQQLLRRTLLEVSVRIGTLAVWSLYSWIFVQMTLPWALTQARIGAAHIFSLHSLLTLGLSIVVLAFCMHLHVVFCRLALLRKRVF
jgi:hypothetical protein